MNRSQTLKTIQRSTQIGTSFLLHCCKNKLDRMQSDRMVRSFLALVPQLPIQTQVEAFPLAVGKCQYLFSRDRSHE